MTHTQALCGHLVPAVGAPHSIARNRCESELCPACQCDVEYIKWEIQRAAIRAAIRERVANADNPHATPASDDTQPGR